CDDPPYVKCRAKSYSAADHLINSGRSLQQSDGNLTSVEICVSVNSALKHQRCRNVCFWKFASLHPISKIVVHLRPESFLSIRKYASYYRLPLRRRVVGQYLERETLPYLNFRLHWNPLICICHPWSSLVGENRRFHSMSEMAMLRQLRQPNDIITCHFSDPPNRRTGFAS